MAIDTIITLELTPYGLKIPERVFVKLNSTLTFKVDSDNDFIKRNDLYRPKIELYFPYGSPDGFTNIYSIELISKRNEGLVLATGTVQSPGDYKYGIRIVDNGKQVFDEDPYLIVYI